MKTIIILSVIILSASSVFSQWQHVTNGMGTNRYIYSLSVQGSNIFAGASTGGVYLSSNNGTSWSQTSLNSPVIQKLFTNGNYVFAGTGSQGVYYTTNNGSNWSQSSLNNKTIFSFTSKNTALFAGSDSNGVYRSTNNGSAWQPSGLSGLTIYSLAQAGGLILAGTSGYGMYVSTDDGSTWIPAPFFNLSVFDFAVDGSVVFAGTSAGIYKSTNNGFNWLQIALEEELVGDIEISGSNLFAGTFSGGVYVSNNYGANWVQRNEGLTQLTSGALCILNNYIFNGTQNSVFRRPLSEIIGIKQISNEVPSFYSLSQNYPNPFNPVTNINFAIPENGFVKLTIFDINGREVETLVNDKLGAGTYNADWNAANYSSGVYFYKLTTKEFSDTKRMVLVK